MAWLIAFAVAILVAISDLATNVIQRVAPWFGVLVIFIIFISIAAKIFGAEIGDFAEVKWIVIVIVIGIFIVGTLMYLRDQTSLPGDIDEDGNVVEGEYDSMSKFIFHPQMMGIIFILLVSVFTVALLAGKVS